MYATLTNHDPALRKLEAEGYRLRIVHGVASHIIVDGIPAVNTKGELVYGSLYSPFEVNEDGSVRSPIANHQCWWIGDDPPCDHLGNVMSELIANPQPENKGDGFTTRVGMSRKKKQNGAMVSYPDYYEKLKTYIALIWSHATMIDPLCTPKVDKVVPAVVEAQDSVFHYPDMATTRAGIGAATEKLIVNKVAIIGLGGTGSYILDLLAKTPVQELHLFDGDEFELHNAFRAPGAPAKEELINPKKVDWFGNVYDRMRRGIIRHPYHVTGDHLVKLAEMAFVFLSIDDPIAKKVIVDYLIARSVPFIDVGLDVSLDRDVSLRGQVRVTTATPVMHSHVSDVISFANGPENNIYRNIQVADLNMLNAAFAVIRWKKWLGFYADDINEYHALYVIHTGSIIKGVVS